MESMQWLTLVIFAVTILIVVSNKIDSTLAGLLGVIVMIWAGVMTEDDAFKYVDWNVMAILVAIWLIAGYFGKSGVPSWLSVQALKLSGGRPGLLVMILTFLAGFISMFVDNVVTILMMAPVALPLSRALNGAARWLPVVLMIGFGANFMGTALIIGDLPPQMLHSVAGAEFFRLHLAARPAVVVPDPHGDFHHHAGVRCGSYGFRGHRQACDRPVASLGIEARDPESAVRYDRGRLVPRHSDRDVDARVHRRASSASSR